MIFFNTSFNHINVFLFVVLICVFIYNVRYIDQKMEIFMITPAEEQIVRCSVYAGMAFGAVCHAETSYVYEYAKCYFSEVKHENLYQKNDGGSSKLYKVVEVGTALDALAFTACSTVVSYVASACLVALWAAAFPVFAASIPFVAPAFIAGAVTMPLVIGMLQIFNRIVEPSSRLVAMELSESEKAAAPTSGIKDLRNIRTGVFTLYDEFPVLGFNSLDYEVVKKSRPSSRPAADVQSLLVAQIWSAEVIGANGFTPASDTSHDSHSVQADVPVVMTEDSSVFVPAPLSQQAARPAPEYSQEVLGLD